MIGVNLARSYLFASGTTPHRIERALYAGADAVILDLEDSVPASAKLAARDNVATALDRGVPNGVELWVRVNQPPLGDDDVRCVAPFASLTGLVVPKVEDEGSLCRLVTLLDQLGAPAMVEPMLETAAGLLNASRLVHGRRVRRTHLGEVDLSADLGAAPGPDDLELLWARSLLVAHAASADAPPPVGPVSREFRDLGHFRESTQALLRLGFWGRDCIHPSQVGIANEVFSSDPTQLEWATQVLDALAHAAHGGKGAAVDIDGRLIDEAVAKLARRVLERSRKPPVTKVEGGVLKNDRL